MTPETTLAQRVDRYLALPYRIELIPSSDGGFGVRTPELPGCISQGDNVEDAYAMIRDAMRAWIASALEDGRPIPEPAHDQDYSGHLSLRMPKSLHRDLATQAKRDGVSLNQWIVYRLAGGTDAGMPDNQAAARDTRVQTDHLAVGQGARRHPANGYAP